MIRILINYSRSGGTLISKILASQADVWLLSEVNPVCNAVGTPGEQAANWYNVKANKSGFLEQVEVIHEEAQKRGKALVIRDFSFINFTPHRLNKNRPSYEFDLIKLLSKKFEVSPIVFLRDAIDVWISRDCPPRFSSHYCKYILKIKALDLPIIKYEDFCSNVQCTLNHMAGIWNMDKFTFDASMLNYHKVTGDNLLSFNSRGSNLSSVELLPRKPISNALQKRLTRDQAIQQANLLLGYGTNYRSRPLEQKSELFVNLQFMIRQLLGKYPSALY